MDYKDMVLLPLKARQYANVLTEIKADLKKSLDAWEGFLNVVEPGLMDEDWVTAENVSGPIVKSVKRIDQALKINVPKTCSVCLKPKEVDWKFMKETNTWQVVCKDCAKIFDNYKGDK